MNPSAKLYKALEQKFQNQFELDVGEGNFVLLTLGTTDVLFERTASSQHSFKWQ